MVTATAFDLHHYYTARDAGGQQLFLGVQKHKPSDFKYLEKNDLIVHPTGSFQGQYCPYLPRSTLLHRTTMACEGNTGLGQPRPHLWSEEPPHEHIDFLYMFCMLIQALWCHVWCSFIFYAGLHE